MSNLSDLAGGISRRGTSNTMEMLAESNASITVCYGEHNNVSYRVTGYDQTNGFLVGERSNGIIELINLKQVKSIIPEESKRDMFR